MHASGWDKNHVPALDRGDCKCFQKSGTPTASAASDSSHIHGLNNRQAALLIEMADGVWAGHPPEISSRPGILCKTETKQLLHPHPAHFL